MTLSLLVIDDDDTVRSTLVEFFETFGFTARGASTATAGGYYTGEVRILTVRSRSKYRTSCSTSTYYYFI